MPKSAKRKPKVDKRKELRAIKFKGYHGPKPIPPEILQMAKGLGVAFPITGDDPKEAPDA